MSPAHQHVPGGSVARPPWRRMAAVAVSALLLAGGCSDGDDDASDATSTDETTTTEAATSGPDAAPEEAEVLDREVPDLCTLFTVEDFQAVTGEVAGAPESQPEVGAIRGSCSTSAEAGFPLVMVAAYNESDREATLSMVEAESVDDLGQEAYWDDTVGLVIPLEGRDWYLQVLATDGGADLESSVEVAEIVLQRLDG